MKRITAKRQQFCPWMTKPTLIRAGQQHFLVFKGSLGNCCVWCSPGTSWEAHTVGGFSGHSAKSPCLWAIAASWRTFSPPLAGSPTTRSPSFQPPSFSSKRGRHDIIYTTRNARRHSTLKEPSVPFLCRLKLGVAAIPPLPPHTAQLQWKPSYPGELCSSQPVCGSPQTQGSPSHKYLLIKIHFLIHD